MAKLVYGPDFGTISVVADDDKINDGDHEVTAEQASAIGTWQSAQMLKAICDSLDEIAAQLPGRK
jgi:hypothetical protein